MNKDHNLFFDSDGIQVISDNITYLPNDNESNVNEDSC